MNDHGADRIEELGTYEMVWDCKFCGTASLPARTHKFCPNCGAAQDPLARRFPADSEKVAVENYVHHGADVICPACGTPNSADAKFCQQCGAGLENAQKVEAGASQVRGESEQFAAQAAQSAEAKTFARDLQNAGVTPDPNAPKRNKLVLYAMIGVVVVVVIGAIVALTAQSDASASLIGHTWERSIAIEQFSSVPDATWCDSIPGGAYAVSQSSRQRSSRSVPDGEACSVRRIDNGDGTFSERRECSTTYRDEPIYDNYCSYTVDRWVYTRQIAQDGESLRDAPRWPLLQINAGTCLGCEREGERSEEYIIALQGADRQYACVVSYEFWQQAQLETQWNFKVNAFTGSPDCDSLQPASS
ncbi:MAG: zinc ribbon domain-containing protein [Chloroflexota bacterium]|nr:zinc ribbon domain-containing protein [Chloroflexota bacterium]